MDLLQLDNWVTNARIRMWRPMVCSVFSQFADKWMKQAKVRARGGLWWLPCNLRMRRLHVHIA